MSMNFDDKDVKRIRPIILPNGQPGALVTYTERSEPRASSPLRKMGISIPKLKPGKKNSPGVSTSEDTRHWRRCLMNGMLIGFVIVAIYLVLRAL